MNMKHLGLIVVLGLATNCSTEQMQSSRTPSSVPDEAPVQLHFLSTTDLHGYLLAQSSKNSLSYGGVDVMNGYFNIAKSADPETLLVDSGDLFQGTIISNTTLGSTVVQWMNYAGYAASAVGNHDFDFGPGDGHAVVVKPGEDPLGALKARESQAKFQFLSANICSVDEDPGKCANVSTAKPASFVQPYMMKTVHGVKLAIIGLTTLSTPVTTMPSNVQNLRFLPLKETLERYVGVVKAAGADAIIVIMHEGGFCEKGQCSPTDPVFKLIDDLSPEVRAQVPLFLAGHTHNYVNKVYNGVHVVITGCYGESFGYTTLTFNPADGSLSVSDVKSVDFCSQVYPDTKSCLKGTGTPVAPEFLGQTVVPDPKAIALIHGDIETANEVSAQVVGKLASPLTRGSGQESSLGDFMADAYRFCKDPTCKGGADIAFENNGGIRSSLIPAGTVTYGQIFQLQPFDNVDAQMELKGSQVHDLLVAWWAYYSGSMPQVSGIHVTFSLTNMSQRVIKNAAGESETLADPITSMTMSDGSPFDESKTYRVGMSDFLAMGGGGTGFVLKGLDADVDYDRKQRDELVDYLKSNPAGLDYDKMDKRLIQQ